MKKWMAASQCEEMDQIEGNKEDMFKILKKRWLAKCESEEMNEKEAERGWWNITNPKIWLSSYIALSET